MKEGFKTKNILKSQIACLNPTRICVKQHILAKSSKSQQLPLMFNNLFLIGCYHRVHREHREMVRKLRDFVRFLRKYTFIFLSVFSVVKSQRELLQYCRDLD